MKRRTFLQQSLQHTALLPALTPTLVPALSTGRSLAAASVATATLSGVTREVLATSDLQIQVISDGFMQLPMSMIMPDPAMREAARKLLGSTLDAQQDDASMKQVCNITLLSYSDKLVLFDVGAGFNFMPTTGELVGALEAIDISPEDITDVVFTHAHPDHLWGLLDDFDELSFPDAQYHIHEREWDYRLDDMTLSQTPEARQSFVVGAQNRLPMIEDRISMFRYGDEVLPGVEAVNTSGHTPGHSAFAIHSGDTSMMIIGDALTHSLISFAHPKWALAMDQSPDEAVKTRLSLLDRLAVDKTPIIGFHLSNGGQGYVERLEQAYRFVAA